MGGKSNIAPTQISETGKGKYMTPSQRINQIADELMLLNKDLDLQVALQNATITYLDEEYRLNHSAKVAS